MRTKNSVNNIISVVIFNVIVGLLGFLKVKVFVNGLSNDVYSLNQLFYQVFGYFAIADIGFGLVLNKQLYNAFAKNDKDEINNIFSTAKRFFNTIAIVLLIVTVFFSFFVHFLTKAQLPNSYIQIIFIIFMFKNIIDYFFVAPRHIIEANQKYYKINYLIKSIKIVEIIVEIILVLYHVNYIIILFPGIIITILLDMYANRIVYKEYPWLKDKKVFNRRYLHGTKDLVYIKLAGLMNSNTDIILISTFINPVSVIIYTSYCYITKFVSDTAYIVANAITPSYANVICNEDKKNSYEVFKELNILFLFIASFVCIMFYGFLNELIVLWVGKNYLVNKFVLFLFCFVSFQLIANRAIYIVINSKGLFKETKIATIVEAILNFIISLLLVNKYGLTGVLFGTIISAFLTSFIQNSHYIYKNLFEENVFKYYATYFISILVIFAFVLGFKYFAPHVTGVISWLILVIIYAIIVALLLFVIYYFIFASFRALVIRGITYIKNKGKYVE